MTVSILDDDHYLYPSPGNTCLPEVSAEIMATLPKRLKDYVQGIPKAELHVHIEGTLEPELMFQLAERNDVKLEGTVESHSERRKNFKNLQDFLDLYYKACSVLVAERDFYDLMYEYLRRASVDNVYVAEIFFDPQTHTERGIALDTVINGLHRALVDGYLNFGIKGSLILCFLRDLSEESAIETLEVAKPHLDKIIGVGLDSGEVGNPPTKFKKVYEMAANLGLKLVAHAGEEAGPNYIYEALDDLRVRRIDHGVQCLKDDALVERLVNEQVPLTTCPCSNEKLKVYEHYFNGVNITKRLLDKGLKVTVNSDDPAYFGGYITDNFLKIVQELNLTERDVNLICRNSFESTFLSRAEIEYYLKELDHFNIAMGVVPPPRSITTFGSRRPKPGSEEYEFGRSLTKLFASKGYRVVSGGYSGMMEAASRGASEGAAGLSEEGREADGCAGVVKGVIAPRVFAGRHSTGNRYLTHTAISRNLSDRIHCLLRESEYYVAFGGTIGTVTEVLVVWNAAALRPMFGGVPQRIFALRSAYEKALKDLIEATKIYPEDVSLVTYFDTAEELLDMIEKDYDQRVQSAAL